MIELTWKEFLRRCDAEPAFSRAVQASSSPGPVAQQLGVSRQRVHQLLNAGLLDAVRIVGADGSTDAVLVFKASVQRRLASRSRTAA